jgi:hypothetical protein
MASHAHICPASASPCNNAWVCDKRQLCTRMHVAPIDVLGADHEPAVHFVGFRGEEIHNARKVFGEPDFYHRVWDHRALCDIAPGDIVVLAKYHDKDPSPYSFDDSNEPDDPAARER